VDLTAISLSKVDKDEFGYLEYGTGLAIEIPEGHVGLLFPRSSISNSGLILTNSVGVIDSKPKVSHV
jgi:dUTP pyrophosphatase